MVSSIETKLTAGEVRLDGHLSAILDTDVWQLEATSWTSPSGKTIPFADAKNKFLHPGAAFFAHFEGERTPIDPAHLAPRSPIAVVGRNRSDGSLDVREMIVFRPIGPLYFTAGPRVDVETGTWCVKAQHAMEQNDPTTAVFDGTHALSFALAANDLVGQRLALKWRAFALTTLRRYDDAQADYTQLQKLSHTAGDASDEASAWEGQASVDMSRGDFASALTCSLQASTLTVSTPSVGMAIWSHLMEEYELLKRNDDAIAAAPLVLTFAAQAHRDDMSARTLIDLAALQSFQRKPAQEPTILQNIAQGRIFLEKVASPDLRAELRFKLAQLLWYRGDHDGAGQEIEKACADFASAHLLPESDRAHGRLKKWQAGGWPYDASTN